MILRWMILVLIAGLALPKAAHADELRPGYLELTQRNQKQWQVLWKAPILGGLATRARPQLPAFCTLQPLDTRLDNGSLISSIRAICQRPLEGEVVGIEGMEASFTDALLRVAPLGRPIQAERLTPDHPTAIVAARTKIVEGAVGMVEMALAMLSEKDIVVLDDDKKAAMVSNLMVVLCGEKAASPVLNTGTLY